MLEKYFYGEGTDNVVELTSDEAAAINKMRIKEVDQKGPNGERLVATNLAVSELKHYNSAADKLNTYLETHDVHASEEYLQDNPLLRPIK